MVTVKRPELKSAVRLTPMEMNNLHFERPGSKRRGGTDVYPQAGASAGNDEKMGRNEV